MRHLLTLTVVVVWAGGACGGDEQVDSVEAAITAGEVCTSHPEVGLFRMGASICSATLVGRRTALTAAHCLAAGRGTLTLESVVYPVAGTVQHPGWDARSLANDLAVLILATAPALAAVPPARRPPSQGLAVALIGFGVTAEGGRDALVKREAPNRIAAIEATRFTVSGSGSGVGNICHGDSGGPALARQPSGQVQLVGVASAGMAPCGTLGYFTRPDVYQEWLNASSAGDLAPPSAADSDEAGGVAGAEVLAGSAGGCSVPGTSSDSSIVLVLVLMLVLVLGCFRLRRARSSTIEHDYDNEYDSISRRRPSRRRG